MIMTLPLELPEDLGRRIEDEAVKRGEAVSRFLEILFGMALADHLRESGDPVARDLAEELILSLHRRAVGMERPSGKALDTLPGLFADGTEGTVVTRAEGSVVEPPPSPPRAQVLQRFRGTVDRVAEGTAYLTLEDDQGRLSSAQMSTEQMQDARLSLAEDFRCTVTRRGGTVEVDFRPIPRRSLSDDEQRQLRDEIDTAYLQRRKAP